MTRPCPHALPALTLPELLIVAAVVAVVMGLLLPALGGVRQEARTVHCGSQLKDLGVAGTHYAMAFHDWLAGSPGTTGQALLFAQQPPESLVLPDLPTQVWDWAVPLAYYGLGYTDLPENRAERLALVREGPFTCNSNRFLSRTYPDSAPDRGWPAVIRSGSYATIREFMYFGKQGNTYDGIHLPFWWNIRTPRPYRPRLSSLMRPADKVWLAEGAPWWPSDAPHDVPIGFKARYGGAFSTAGPPSSFSRGFANNMERRDPLDGGAQPMLRDAYAYRHAVAGEPGMQTLRFDGHVSPLTKIAALRNIDLWYPSGSQVKATEFENGPFPKPSALAVIAARGVSAENFYPVY